MHDVPSGAKASAGQVELLPVQVSAGSHWPVLARQTVPAGSKSSAGQAAAEPVQCSATSQMPAAGLHSTVVGWKASGGQVVLVPVHVSATSHAPAVARQVAPALPAGCWHVTAAPSHWSREHGLPSSVHAVPT